MYNCKMKSHMSINEDRYFTHFYDDEIHITMQYVSLCTTMYSKLSVLLNYLHGWIWVYGV